MWGTEISSLYKSILNPRKHLYFDLRRIWIWMKKGLPPVAAEINWSCVTHRTGLLSPAAPVWSGCVAPSYGSDPIHFLCSESSASSPAPPDDLSLHTRSWSLPSAPSHCWSHVLPREPNRSRILDEKHQNLKKTPEIRILSAHYDLWHTNSNFGYYILACK